MRVRKLPTDFRYSDHVKWSISTFLPFIFPISYKYRKITRKSQRKLSFLIVIYENCCDPCGKLGWRFNNACFRMSHIFGSIFIIIYLPPIHDDWLIDSGVSTASRRVWGAIYKLLIHHRSNHAIQVTVNPGSCLLVPTPTLMQTVLALLQRYFCCKLII